MTDQAIAVPNLKDLLLPEATSQLETLGLGITIAPGPDGNSSSGNDEARIERNGPGFDPGSMVNPGTTVGVILYPHEPRQ